MCSFAVKCVDSLPDRCLEVVSLDIDEIEDYLTKINLVDVPTVKMMAAGFKCPISALPFGALKSDWSRLLLLQEAQPDSIIKRKLVRLMRFLIVAYYQMEESFDVIKPDMQILQALIKERMATSLAASKSRNLSANQSWTTESLGNYYHHLHPYSSPITLHKVLYKNDCSTGNLNSTAKAEIPTAKIFSNLKEPDVTTVASLVPIDLKIPNVSTMINLSAVTARYRPIAGAVEAAAENATSTAPGNCLRQSLKDILSRKPPNRTRYPVFERLQNKKHGGRAPQRRNEINGCAKNADVPAKISPLANDFWRYAQFPTGVPLTISTIARPYRVQGLNGFRMNPRKSRKRAGLNSDGHTKATEVLRRLTKIKKNKEVR
ncbi:uncharacterized protein LOC116850406 isoform X2 [Odontomachus brunneus]|uniref:uncharacterized protein LOC116850406 isoform X2 n=1 Tax=Odontomachus brunneus TaxID=486640 RepID=UPI0013F2718D|nr:uncharacterized protein LOC116850406 isoform X2 [Odontomachus brunneus]